jgi:hypothetical protein
MPLPYLVSELRPGELRGTFFPSWPALFRHLLRDPRSVAFRLAPAPKAVLRRLKRDDFAPAPRGYRPPAVGGWVRLGTLG